MSVISERTGQKTVISVIERFPLTMPGMAKPPRARRASAAQPSYRGETPSLKNHRQATKPALTQIVAERQERDLEKFNGWAKDAIQAQQNDIDRINGSLDSMERALNSFKTFMEEARTELAAQRQFRYNLQNEELAALRRDIIAIQAELNANRQLKNSLRKEEFPVLQEDIDALSSELSQTQDFQHRLRLQDVRSLQQNLDDLRRNVERMAYLGEDGPKISCEIFETLVDDVREVDRKAREVVSVRAELKQFKARLASVETSILEPVPPRRIVTSTVKRTPDQIFQTASYKENATPTSKTSHLSKRKYLQSDCDTNSAYEPPTKRLMDSTTHTTSILSSGNASSKSLTVRFQPGDSPIILSSNLGTSAPISDPANGQRERNGKNATKKSSNRTGQSPNLSGDYARSSQKFGTKEDTGSSKIHVTPDHVLERTARNSVRTESAGMHPSLHGHNKSDTIKSAQNSEERVNNLIKSSNKENLRPRRFRHRSDTPDQLSTPFVEEAMLKSVHKRRAGRPKENPRSNFGTVSRTPIDSDSPVPSIENATEKRAIQAPVPIPSISSPKMVSSIAADLDPPFACSQCGKQYKFVANLERHMVISSRCRVGNEAAGSAPETDEEVVKKKRKIKERERLATEILAKQ